MTIYATKHAVKRAHQRCGLKRKSVLRQAKRVFDKGTPLQQLEDKGNFYLKNASHTGDSNKLIIKHGSFYYVFRSTVEKDIALITIIHS